MKCHEAEFLVEDYLEGLLSPAQSDSFTAHYRQCQDCAQVIARARQLQERLKSAPVPPPSAGFADRVLRNAVRHAGPAHQSHLVSHRRGFIKGFGSAMAAGLAIWAVASLFPARQMPLEPARDTATVANRAPAQLESAAALSISLYEPTDITLAFHAAQAVQGATITISLSDNLELVGYQDHQRLEWVADLRAGDNVLMLPVRALSPRDGTIVAQISHNNLMKSIELKLNVSGGKPVSENRLISPLA